MGQQTNAPQVYKQMMKALLCFSVALSLFMPCILNAQNNSNKTDDDSPMSHEELPIAVPDNAPTPALSLEIYSDSMSGYNLILNLENYQMSAPPRESSMSEMMSASIDQQTGYIEGHAHLLINGTKVQRIYGDKLHLTADLFTSGLNQITVTLNNHGHMFWTIKETQILSTLFFNNDGVPSIVHEFASFPKQGNVSLKN